MIAPEINAAIENTNFAVAAGRIELTMSGYCVTNAVARVIPPQKVVNHEAPNHFVINAFIVFLLICFVSVLCLAQSDTCAESELWFVSGEKVNYFPCHFLFSVSLSIFSSILSRRLMSSDLFASEDL